MAQQTSRTGGSTRLEMVAKNTGIIIPATGNTVLATLPVIGLSTIAVQVDVSVNALDTFLIAARFHPDGSFVTLYSTTGAFTTPAGLLIGASGDLTGQAAGTTGWFVLDVRGLYEVRVSASGTTNDLTSVSLYASGA